VAGYDANRMEVTVVQRDTFRFHSIHSAKKKNHERMLKRLSDNRGVKRSINRPSAEEFSDDVMVMKSTKGLSVAKSVGLSAVPGKHNSLFF
jgi:hypothetical protein